MKLMYMHLRKDGLGYRIVSEFDWNELSILVDLGWVLKKLKKMKPEQLVMQEL